MGILFLGISVFVIGAIVLKENLLPDNNQNGLKLSILDFFRLKNYNVFSAKKEAKNTVHYVINRKTGNKNLVMVDSGRNKAVVLSTLRQITNIDKQWANGIINQAPSTFMTNVSEQEADLTKQALEFVGAKIEIK